MKESAHACMKCVLTSTCDPALPPRHTSGQEPHYFINCRHFSCPDGLHAAAIAHAQASFTGVWGEFESASHGTYETIHAVPFHTIHKSRDTRIVDTDGVIWSEQRGIYYQTGQEMVALPGNTLIYEIT